MDLEDADDRVVSELREHLFHVAVGDVGLVAGVLGFEPVVRVDEHDLIAADVEAREILSSDERPVAILVERDVVRTTRVRRQLLDEVDVPLRPEFAADRSTGVLAGKSSAFVFP